MKYFVGLDLGGTNISAGLLDENGTVLAQRSSALTSTEPSAVVNQLAHEARMLLTDVKLDIGQVTAVGIGSPGILDTQKGIVHRAANLPGWQDVPLTARVEALLGRPCVLEGDGTCATAAEFWIGAGKSKQPSRFALLTLGTGIGGGLVLDGNTVHGWIEPGHVLVHVDGRPCGCGARGCLERYCSAAAVARTARERLQAGEKSALATYKTVECADVFAEAAKGDAFAKSIVKEAIHYLALGCIAIMRIVDPQVFAMSGGMILAGPMLFDALNDEIRRLNWTIAAPVNVVPAEVGNKAGLVGAAYAALKFSQRSKL